MLKLQIQSVIATVSERGSLQIEAIVALGIGYEPASDREED